MYALVCLYDGIVERVQLFKTFEEAEVKGEEYLKENGVLLEDRADELTFQFSVQEVYEGETK